MIQVPFFPSAKDHEQLEHIANSQGLDLTSFDSFDDNVKELITRLVSSSSRSAFLANSLAELQRRMAYGQVLGVTSSEEEGDTDLEPQETEESK